MNYEQGVVNGGRGAGLCRWSEKDQEFSGLYDLSALHLCDRSGLPNPADLQLSAAPGAPWRAPDEEVLQLDGPQWVGNWLVPGGRVMAEGWLMATNAERWTYRFHRDERSLTRDPKVFVDMGRPMPDGSPALLKTRQHLRREEAEVLLRTLLRSGLQRVSAVWGIDGEP